MSLGGQVRPGGTLADGVPLLEESLTIYQELGHGLGILGALSSLATAAVLGGDQQRSVALFEESLTLAGTLGNTVGIVACLRGLGVIAAARDQATRAARLFGAAAALREGAGDPHSSLGALQEYHFSAVRAKLGEAAWAAAWAQGRDLTVAEAIAEALA